MSREKPLFSPLPALLASSLAFCRGVELGEQVSALLRFLFRKLLMPRSVSQQSSQTLCCLLVLSPKTKVQRASLSSACG